MNKITSVAANGTAAVALVAGVISLVATQAAFASCGHGDGNTCISFKNKAKANASGFGSLAANVQQNQINFNTAAP